MPTRKSGKPAKARGAGGWMAALQRVQPIARLSPDLTLLEANEPFGAMLGRALDELAGLPLSELIDTGDKGSDLVSTRAQLAQGATLSHPLRLTGPEGGPRVAQAAFVPVTDRRGKLQHVVLVLTDISALQKERDGIAAELKIRNDILNLTCIVSEANRKGEIISCNDKYVEISRFSRAELMGKPHNITRHPDMPREVFKEMWNTIGHGKMFRGVIKNRAKDGSIYFVDAVVAPILGANGKPERYLGVRYDITEAETERRNGAWTLAAINAVFAFVEFSLEGEILAANDNYLQLMGYQRGEVIGRKHRLLIDSKEAANPEYQSLWTELAAGRAQTRISRRIGRDGQEVWLQANYVPVKNEVGRVLKIFTVATDVTEQMRIRNALDSAVAETQEVLEAAAGGELRRRIRTEDKPGQVEALCRSVNDLLDSVNRMVEQIKTASLEVSTSAAEISEGNMSLSQRTEEQAASLEQTASSMEQMTSTVRATADNAARARQLAMAARERSDKGHAVVDSVVKAMSEIRIASKKIADIIGVIDEIAFQTNLLALNAAVEAARAGDQGRSFAVVATEVRNLAARSATAAKEIKSLILSSVAGVEEGSRLADQSGQALNEIGSAVKNVTDVVAEIAAATQEQSSGIEQVNKAVIQMDRATQENAAQVEHAAAASRLIAERAAELAELVARYRVSADGDDTGATGSDVRSAA